jgi:ATP-dependent DNA helicase RecG
MTVQSVNVDGCECVVIVVSPTDDPPIRYKGRVWVRVATTTLVASPQDERILLSRRSSRDLPADHRPLHGSSIADLDLGYFENEYLRAAYAPDVLEANDRTTHERLVALRFMSGSLVTAGGIIVLGNDPQYFVPGSYVQFTAYRGTSVTDNLSDQKVFSGKIASVARSILELVNLAIPVGLSRDNGFVDAKRPRYPFAALRELIINALIHRDYEGGNAPVRVSLFDDRIEIWNAGGLYGSVRPDTLGHDGVTAYRNPTIADAMKTLGYAQRFGYGIPYARKALAGNGNPAPEFQIDRGYINVVVRAAPI